VPSFFALAKGNPVPGFLVAPVSTALQFNDDLEYLALVFVAALPGSCLTLLKRFD
jgi:hypothetical protein